MRGSFLLVRVPQSTLQPMYSRHLSLRSRGMRLRILPLRSHEYMSDTNLSVGNSMLLIRLKVLSSMMYERLAAGMMRRR